MPCPIVFGELQLGVRRRRKEEGEEEESQVAEEEEKEEREVGKGSQRKEERRSSNNSTSGRFCHSKFRETSLRVFGSILMINIYIYFKPYHLLTTWIHNF